MNEFHITTMGWASTDELQQMSNIALQVNAMLTELFKQADIELVDFKL